MKIYLKNSASASCRISINDGCQTKVFVIKSDEIPQEVALELNQNEFDIFISLVFDLSDDDFKSLGNNSLKDKLLVKLSKTFVGAIDKLAFKVDCAYRLSDINDGAIIEITSPVYFFDIFDVLEFFELLPMEYLFPKLSLNNGSIKLMSAKGQDRKRFLKYSFRFGFVYYGLTGIWKLPLQYQRLKYLSKDKVVFKKLKKFLSLSPEEQDKLLDKQTKILEKY